jgi:hypothetical protein
VGKKPWREPLHHQQLRNRGDDRADDVIDNEITRAERTLDHPAKHVQRDHVEQDVLSRHRA